MSEKAWLTVLQAACAILVTIEGIYHQFLSENQEKDKK